MIDCIDNNYLFYTIYTAVVIIYLILLGLAIYFFLHGFFCDEHTCQTFLGALTKTTDKKVVIDLLDRLCEQDHLWAVVFITSSIIMFLLVAVLPMPLCLSYFVLIFLLSFI